jgi:hypothetical protein
MKIIFVSLTWYMTVNSNKVIVRKYDLLTLFRTVYHAIPALLHMLRERSLNCVTITFIPLPLVYLGRKYPAVK